MGPLETLLWVYPLLLLLNGFIAVALWTIYRKSIFGLLVGVWASTLVNFSLQGAFLESSLASVLGFSTYIVTAWFLCKILCTITHQLFSFHSYWGIYLLALFTSVAVHYFDVGFPWVALPVALAVAIPQIKFAFLTLMNSQLQSLVRIFAIVLLINGLHFIDYPFLRPIPEAAIFGYSLVIATSMLFGVLLPCVINNFLADELNRQLRDEVVSHQKTALELEQALVVTEQSSRAKTVFLANVSHHLRTPINGIMGLNDLLLESHLDSVQRNLVQQVHASSNELLNMVDNVLTISLLESEKVKLYPKALSLQQIINDIFDYYAHYAPQGLRLINQPNASHQQWVYADALKIRQICLNLIDNALRHSAGTRATLSIKLDTDDSNDPYSNLQIRVSDDGVGVSAERLAALRLPFKQDVQSIHCGMGLGLSIVRELVTLMSGQLSLESTPGHGFSACCQIPVKLLQGEHVTPSAAALSASDSSEPSTMENKSHTPEGKTTAQSSLREGRSLVLVVEDNPVNRMVISGMLKKLAIDFCMAEDGAQAMDLYYKHQAQLACILMDVQLPDANGLDLVEKIRKQGDQVPVLVISAFTFGDDEARAINVGADAYLRKPYHFDEFKNALDDLGIPVSKLLH